ncbi:Predicted oxidoreductase [Solimonas aquatica]|uniref:Predicted oxidoreductase n=1 Tax=Solimonas aquatica TaxID=489703 RepID=A0A1H9GDC8_9GAMM|nr:aldo/keto reductase [Solimonas aquatica]SEQ48111.1 Predicted oxidoreductase [Solimonas aquatica]
MQLDDYRLLGRSGLRVSPLALGTMNFAAAGSWAVDEAPARELLAAYTEAGGNALDTANFYGAGESERLLGRLLGAQRQRYVLASKYSLSMSPGDANASGNQRKNMLRSVEDSLRRLNTDYLDLFYLHMWDGCTPVEEILRAFDDLVRAGKVLYIGLSDTPAWQASRMQAIAELRGWSSFAALQIPYNLTERTVERELLPMAQEMGLGVLPWSPLAGGVLSGKYGARDLNRASAESGSRQAINLATGRLSERNLRIAAVVQARAAALGCTASQLALAWTLHHPAVVSPILGVRTLAQLQDNLAALRVSLDAETLSALQEVSRIEPGFPHELLDTARRGPLFGNIKLQPRRVP